MIIWKVKFQKIANRVFCKYDNKGNNQKIYNSKHPPKYDLSKIKFPVHLFVGANDQLATPKDNERLKKELVNSQCTMEVIKDYGHISFLISKNRIVIDKVIDIIEKSKD